MPRSINNIILFLAEQNRRRATFDSGALFFFYVCIKSLIDFLS